MLFAAHHGVKADYLHEDRNAAVIYVYHHIDEDHLPDSSIRFSYFESHIREIMNGDYTVLPLPQILDAFERNESLPRNTIAITFDIGHASIMKQAVPLLIENNLPFTVFIAPDHADRNANTYLNWNDIKRLLRSNLVTLGIHPAPYERLYTNTDTDIKTAINRAKLRFREMTGTEAQFFAYPYGEYSRKYRDIIAASNFRAAFAQQSGVASGASDIYALPRFTMTDQYGDTDRFRMTSRALPLHVTDVIPQDNIIDGSKLAIGFTLHPDLKARAGAVNCFVSSHENYALQRFESGRLEIELEGALHNDRTRVNCTMLETFQDEEIEPRWRWFGMLLAKGEQQEANN